MTNKCLTCGSTATIDNGSACAQCGCDRDADERLALTNCSALATLQGCGLHPGYYDTIEKAAQGARDIIYALRANLHDPPHDIQCAVLRKLGVEGFTKEGVAPTHQLIPLSNDTVEARRK